MIRENNIRCQWQRSIQKANDHQLSKNILNAVQGKLTESIEMNREENKNRKREHPINPNKRR